MAFLKTKTNRVPKALFRVTNRSRHFFVWTVLFFMCLVSQIIMNFSTQAETRIMGMVMYRKTISTEKHPSGISKQAIVVRGIPPIIRKVASMLPIAKKKNAQTCFPMFLGQSRSCAIEISATWGKAWPRKRGQMQRVLLEGFKKNVLHFFLGGGGLN